MPEKRLAFVLRFGYIFTKVSKEDFQSLRDFGNLLFQWAIPNDSDGTL